MFSSKIFLELFFFFLIHYHVKVEITFCVPFLYDFATRGLFALLLHEGYQGKYRKIWQKALDNSAILTLNMLSANGDLPAGGRSQQFLHNDAPVALLAEYYAASFAQKGDMFQLCNDLPVFRKRDQV